MEKPCVCRQLPYVVVKVIDIPASLKKMFPGFECFLSHDEAGEGERYKQSPKLAAECIGRLAILPLKGKNLIFKRWDNPDNPEAVIFLLQLMSFRDCLFWLVLTMLFPMR